jgi:homoserine kinase
MDPHRDDGVRAFAPGSVGNIGVGFDLLGHSIVGPRDVAIVRRIDEPTVRIDVIRGAVSGVDRLPLQPPELNTAGRALQALREGLGLGHGFAVELEKGIPVGSGPIALTFDGQRVWVANLDSNFVQFIDVGRP